MGRGGIGVENKPGVVGPLFDFITESYVASISRIPLALSELQNHEAGLRLLFVQANGLDGQTGSL